MGTEKRAGSSGRYYYRATWVGGRTVKTYGGSGEMADLSAKMAEYERQLRDLDEMERRFDLETLQLQTAAFRSWFSAADRLVAAAMERVGFRRVRRQWRRKRGTGMSALKTVEDVRRSWVPTELVREAGGLLDDDTRQRANALEVDALRVVRDYLGRSPAAVALYGDVGYETMASWVAAIAGRDVARLQAIALFADDLRTRLAGPGADPLVLLLAERTVLAWLFAAWCDLEYARVATTADPRAANFHLRRMEMAQRQLLTAARTLAKVKRGKLADVLTLVNVQPPVEVPPGPRVVGAGAGAAAPPPFHG